MGWLHYRVEAVKRVLQENGELRKQLETINNDNTLLRRELCYTNEEISSQNVVIPH